LELYKTQSIDSNEPIARGARIRTGTAPTAQNNQEKKGKRETAPGDFPFSSVKFS